MSHRARTQDRRRKIGDIESEGERIKWETCVRRRRRGEACCVSRNKIPEKLKVRRVERERGMFAISTFPISIEREKEEERIGK